MVRTTTITTTMSQVIPLISIHMKNLRLTLRTKKIHLNHQSLLHKTLTIITNNIMEKSGFSPGFFKTMIETSEPSVLVLKTTLINLIYLVRHSSFFIFEYTRKEPFGSFLYHYFAKAPIGSHGARTIGSAS